MDNISSLPDADTNLMFLFFPCRKPSGYVSRELFATGRNSVCVATLRNSHKFQLAQYHSVAGTMQHLHLRYFHALTRKIPTESNSWFSCKGPSQNTPSTLRSTWTHNFLDADICKPICLACCGYFLLVMKIAQSGRELIFFLPSRRCWCGQLGASSFHQLFTSPACVDSKPLCHNGWKAERKELTLLKNEVAMIWQWNSMDSFNFVGQGAGNGSVSLLFLPVILSPLL